MSFDNRNQLFQDMVNFLNREGVEPFMRLVKAAVAAYDIELASDEDRLKVTDTEQLDGVMKAIDYLISEEFE